MAIGKRMRGFFQREAGKDSGQMSIELMVVLPVALAVSLVAVNALCFFGDCAAFDRVARNAVRVYASSPGYGIQAGQTQAKIALALEEAMGGEFRELSVRYEGMAAGFVRYTATLEYAPNLFGLGMRESVFGVQLPRLTHSISLVVDTYKPGVFFE